MRTGRHAFAEPFVALVVVAGLVVFIKLALMAFPGLLGSSAPAGLTVTDTELGYVALAGLGLAAVCAVVNTVAHRLRQKPRPRAVVRSAQDTGSPLAA